MLNPYLKLIFKPNPKARLNGSLGGFYDFDADYFSKKLSSEDPHNWQKIGEKMALDLFRTAAKRVPAYKDFLKKSKINPEKIKNIKDFRSLPVIDKESYLKRYPLEMLCWDGKLEKNHLFSVSSGSSGIPFFWPRGENLELETSLSHEMLLRDIFEADTNSTLFIITFSMGIYIAGVITLNSVLRTSQKGYPITIISPGINSDETLRIMEEVAGKFDQTIIAGYPPFVKDIIDQGEAKGLNWKKLKVKFLFATEGFSEKWRDYVLEKVGAGDPLKSSCNIYGSAEAGILGHETPLSIFIKRKASKNSKIAADLFGKNRLLPTFVQYNPLFKFFETINKELIFSSFGGIPLVRYNIHDSGGIKDFEEVASILTMKEKKTLEKTCQNRIWKLPFLYVFGKSDNTCFLYGVNIYPENIKAALEEELLQDWLTGRFVMQVDNEANQDQYLEINIELKDRIKPSPELEELIKKTIIAILEKNNLEYNRLRQAIGSKADPRIKLRLKGDKKYFKSDAIKQKWAKK